MTGLMARRGVLLTMAIGDAHGMGYEFVKDPAYFPVHAEQVVLEYKTNPNFADYKAGHYSDDTQMALANAEMMLAGKAWTRERLADAFVDAFKRDPHFGYSRYMYATLTRVLDGPSFLASIDPAKSKAGGAAMRAGPFGLMPDIGQVKDIAKIQASVTHDNETGIVSAQAVALTVHYMHYRLGAKDGLMPFLASHIGADFLDKADPADPSNGLTIVGQALHALMASQTLGGVLRHAVALGPGQDTDTVSAIAMAMAARSAGHANDLPESLYGGLESGSYGRDYLTAVDGDLLFRYPASALRKSRDVSPGPG